MAVKRKQLSRNPERKALQQQGRIERVVGPLRSQTGRVVAETQHPTQGPPRRSRSQFEELHYGGDPKSGSDLERMRAGGGLATGRPSPRIPTRVNAAAATLVHHGLASPGDVDPNQGRLLTHTEMGRLTKTDEEMAKQTGVPSRRPAGRGFMTGVGSTQQRTPYDTSAEARAAGDIKSATAIAQRKKEVISTAAEKIGSPTPVKSAMEGRAQYESDAPTKWYAEGAHEAIEHEAIKSGVTHNVMRRATALTSPQKAWDTGHPQDANYSQPNVEVAGHLTRFLGSEKERLGKSYRPTAAAYRFRMPGVGHTEETPNLVQGQSRPVRRSVAQHLDKPTHTNPDLATDVQKVRNFDVALAAGSSSQWARRQAHQAYTSDTHDIRAAGITGKYQSFVGAPKASGGYEFAAMTGRRGSMRQSVRAQREGRQPRTPSEYQENVWTGKRGPNQPKAHKVPGVGTGRQVLFERNAGGEEKPSKLAFPKREE